MKKLFYFVLSIVLFTGLASCQREDVGPVEKPVRYANLQVNVGRDTDGVESEDTKSIVSSDVENFHVAILFAMDPNTGKVLTYGSNAGDMEGKPVIFVTTNSTFSWALPLETRFDIYAIVNYGNLTVNWNESLNTLQLGNFYNGSGSDLTVSDLQGITFSCVSATALAALETNGYGLPMAGITKVFDSDIVTGNEVISIKSKKLFARYNLYFDLSELAPSGTSVVAESAVIYNMNNTVHYFVEGDVKTGDVDVNRYDRATDEQLDILQVGGNSNQVVFYVLENMQGNKSGASSWQTVYNDLKSAVKNCTYLNISVNIVNNVVGRAESRQYRVYLGKTDMKSNFDVQRNYDKTIKLKIKDVPTNNFFNWTNSEGNRDYSVLTVGPEESIDLYFKTDIGESDCDYIVYNKDTGDVIPEAYYNFDTRVTVNAGQKLYKKTFTPHSSINVGTKLKVTGGQFTGGESGIKDDTYLDILDLEENVITLQEVYFYSNQCSIVANLPKDLLSDVIVNFRVYWFNVSIRIPARPAGFMAANKVNWHQGQENHSQICGMLGISSGDLSTVKELTGTNKGPITCTIQDDVYKYSVNSSSTRVYFGRQVVPEAPDTPSHYIRVFIRRPSTCSPYGYTASVESDINKYNGIQWSEGSPGVDDMWFKVRTSDGRYFWIIPQYASGTTTYNYYLRSVYYGDFSNGDYGYYTTSSFATPSFDSLSPALLNYCDELGTGIPLTWVDVFFPYGKPAYTTVTITEHN